MKALFLTPIKEEMKHLFTDEGIEAVFKDRTSVVQDDFKDIDIVFGNTDLDLVNSSNIKWLQLDSAGANTYKDLKDSILLTNCAGAYGIAISEHMLACTLSVIKNLYQYNDLQKNHAWMNLGSVPTISKLKVLSVGMGDIGSNYAERMHLLGAKVYGIRRTVHDKPDYLEELYTMKDLNSVLPMMDVVALSLPQTDETIHLFDYARFHHMKKGAILINVGRGTVLKETDLIKVMKEHYLSAACLDVTEHEPLPVNNALWNTENVYLTPHISGRFNAETTYDLVIDIFLTNLKHYLKQEPLEHVVDRKLGY